MPVLGCSLDHLTEEPVAEDIEPRQAESVGRQATQSGRLWGKVCHHKQPKEERPTTSATAGRFVCSITRGQTVLEELLEKDAVVELDNYRD